MRTLLCFLLFERLLAISLNYSRYHPGNPIAVQITFDLILSALMFYVILKPAPGN